MLGRGILGGSGRGIFLRRKPIPFSIYGGPRIAEATARVTEESQEQKAQPPPENEKGENGQ